MLYIKHMIRTQVYLPKVLYNEVQLVAQGEKKARAAVIRELLEQGIAQKKKQRTAGEALLELARLGKRLNLKGPKDLSINHDKYYEEI